MVAIGYCRLQQVTEWLQWVTAGYRVFTEGYSRLQQVTEWLQKVTAGYRVVTLDYNRLPGYPGGLQITELLQ